MNLKICHKRKIPEINHFLKFHKAQIGNFQLSNLAETTLYLYLCFSSAETRMETINLHSIWFLKTNGNQKFPLDFLVEYYVEIYIFPPVTNDCCYKKSNVKGQAWCYHKKEGIVILLLCLILKDNSCEAIYSANETFK